MMPCLYSAVSQQDTKMQKLETAMNSMSSSLESVASKMQQTGWYSHKTQITPSLQLMKIL